MIISEINTIKTLSKRLLKDLKLLKKKKILIEWKEGKKAGGKGRIELFILIGNFSCKQ